MNPWRSTPRYAFAAGGNTLSLGNSSINLTKTCSEGCIQFAGSGYLRSKRSVVICPGIRGSDVNSMTHIVDTGVGASPSHGLSEGEVIRKAQGGDLKSFEELYTRHKARIFSLCLRMSNNYSHAEELTQETFLQLYRKLSSFRGESAFSTWLHRISVNVVLTRFRGKR